MTRKNVELIVAVPATLLALLFAGDNVARGGPDPPGGTLQGHACTQPISGCPTDPFNCTQITYDCGSGGQTYYKEPVIYFHMVCAVQPNTTCDYSSAVCAKDEYYAQPGCSDFQCNYEYILSVCGTPD